MIDYRQLAVACRFGSVSKSDIEAFIQSTMDSGVDFDCRLFEAHTKDLGMARAKVLEFIEFSYPAWDCTSDDGLRLCKAELKRQIGLLLERKITPSSFCRFFNAMECALVVDNDLSSDEVSFLGDLYNACDWCDDTWILENATYLAEESARVASHIDQA